MIPHPKMEELKVHIQCVILWESKNNKIQMKQKRIFIVFMAKVSLLTTKSEIGFHSFVLVIRH